MPPTVIWWDSYLDLWAQSSPCNMTYLVFTSSIITAEPPIIPISLLSSTVLDGLGGYFSHSLGAEAEAICTIWSVGEHMNRKKFVLTTPGWILLKFATVEFSMVHFYSACSTAMDSSQSVPRNAKIMYERVIIPPFIPEDKTYCIWRWLRKSSWAISVPEKNIFN